MSSVEWSTACPNWERRILARESLIPFAPLFPDEAADALRYFGELKMVDAPGVPTMGEVSLPWVNDFVSAIFGSYDPDSGRRLIQEFFLLISKKNGKSTDAAGIMMTALIRNWRRSGEFIILAPTVEVANNSFFPARDMVREDDELRDLMHVQEHYRTITNRETGATLKVVAADNDTVGGKKAIGVFVDELWLFGKKPGAENMLREACGGLASRPEGFVIYASTQSDEPPAGVFRQKLMYARGVRDGRILDPKFLPVLYEYPKAMLDAGEHRNPANFYVTNPNLGASVDREFLEREFAKANESGAESMVGFLAKHLNIEIGLALMSDRWAGADFWERNALPVLTLDELIRRCDVATVGIDGGGLDDLLGLAVIGRDRETAEWLAWCKAWAHPSVLERRKSEAARFQDFAAQGDLVLVKAIGDDVREVGDIVEQVAASGLLDRDDKARGAIGVDAVGLGSILDELDARGIEVEAGPECQVVAVSQGWRLAGSIKTTERRLAEGTLKHAGAALMAWCVGNAKIEPRANSVMITKQASGFAKIDPLMALFNAAELMSRVPVSDGLGSYGEFIRRQADPEPVDGEGDAPDIQPALVLSDDFFDA